jgi:hypothetical protein
VGVGAAGRELDATRPCDPGLWMVVARHASCWALCVHADLCARGGDDAAQLAKASYAGCAHTHCHTDNTRMYPVKCTTVLPPFVFWLKNVCFVAPENYQT